jgi:formate dehydrogenase major subunit
MRGKCLSPEKGPYPGDLVDAESRHGQARLPARIDASVRPGELFATFHTTSTFINHVTGSGQDAITHTPEYKRTAVRIHRQLPGSG